MKLVEKVQSRKFLLTVGTAVYFACQGEPAWAFLQTVVLAYVALQAASEGFAAYTTKSSTELPAD